MIFAACPKLYVLLVKIFLSLCMFLLWGTPHGASSMDVSLLSHLSGNVYDIANYIPHSTQFITNVCLIFIHIYFVLLYIYIYIYIYITTGLLTIIQATLQVLKMLPHKFLDVQMYIQKILKQFLTYLMLGCNIAAAWAAHPGRVQTGKKTV